MHPNPAFHLKDEAALLALARMRPFASVIAVSGNRPYIAQTPVIANTFDETPEFLFHLAHNNPAAIALQESGRALISFTGPDAYISPDWYDLPDQVPTWNYLSAEAEGPIEELGDSDKRVFLQRLADHYEKALAPKPVWTRQKMNPDRFEALHRAVVGFRLIAERFEGVRKLSQNKHREARIKAGKALAISGGNSAIAAMMMNNQLK